MILIITKDNEKLVSEVCLENNIEDFQIITTVANLYHFTVTELKSLNNFSQLIIDITSINDTDKQLIDAIVTLKTIYIDLKITILAIGYKEGNSLLSRLFSESIFNFVTSTEYHTQKEQLKKCITVGNSYSDSISYRFKEDNKDIPKSKVIIKKEYSKRKNSVTIGIVGTQAHIGASTQAILMCAFLKSIGLHSCYVQANQNKDVEKIAQMNNMSEIKDMITYNDIDMYKDFIDNKSTGYDFYIYDYGNIDNFNIDSYITNEIKIIVCGTKEWDFIHISKVFQNEKLNKILNDINFIFNFTAKESEKNILSGLKDLKKNIFFSEYAPNPFDSEKNQNIYHRILKEYIIEKTNQLEILEKNKFSMKNIFAKRKKNEK